MRRPGFTLIELLVVISIIALMIAILLPTLRSARQVAMSAQCKSNLKQYGIASYAYITDHNGYVIGAHMGDPAAKWGKRWAYVLASLYMSNPGGVVGSNHWLRSTSSDVTLCPSDPYSAGIEQASNGGDAMSYIANGDVMHHQAAVNPDVFREIEEFKQPSATLQISEKPGWLRPGSHISVLEYRNGSEATQHLEYRHVQPYFRTQAAAAWAVPEAAKPGYASNNLFVDAHVKSVSWEDMDYELLVVGKTNSPMWHGRK